MKHAIRRPTLAVLALLVAPALLAPALGAQRQEASFQWQRRTTTIAYGAVPLGKHTLSELKSGDSWRLGMNEATTWQLAMPLLFGDSMLAPGQYRIALARDGETSASITVAGSGHALGGADLRVPGTLGTSKDSTKKLAIELKAAAPAKDAQPKDAQAEDSPSKPIAGGQSVAIDVHFGTDAWTGRVTALGGSTSTRLGGGWVLDVFAVPSALVAARATKPIVAAAIHKRTPADGAPAGWNLVLAGSEARLVPWMVAPTAQNGFGAVEPPAESWITRGTCAESATEVEEEALELRDASGKAGQFTFTFASDRLQLEVAIAEPKAAKKN
ncbi:MAG: DUF2911 domain-containing protein [Planctomycetes bacterium]|nr:DUF2911 domain-containing protein [Planctomycetota bacterium]